MCSYARMYEALATVTVISCEHTYINVYVRAYAGVRTCVCACVCAEMLHMYVCAQYLLGNRYIQYVFLRIHSLQYVDGLWGCRESYIDVCSSSSPWYTEDYLCVVVTTGKWRCNRVPCLVWHSQTYFQPQCYDCAIENGRKRVWATPDCSLPFQVERSSRCVYILVSHSNSDVALEFSSCDARAGTCVGTALPYMLATAPKIDWLSGGGRGMWTTSYSVMVYR